ncbi:hypothetical protein D3C73_998160 [compost metagenome]
MAVLEAVQRLHVRRRLGVQPQAPSGQRGALGRQARIAQFGLDFLHSGAQGVDPQVHRRAAAQTRDLVAPAVAVDRLQVRRHEVRQGDLGQVRRVVARRQAAALMLGQRPRAVAFAGVQRLDRLERQAVQHGQGADDQGAPVLSPAHEGRQAAARAQHLIDALGDGAAVARTGIAVLLAPGLEHGVRGLAALRDAVEDGGGGGQAGGWGQCELK